MININKYVNKFALAIMLLGLPFSYLIGEQICSPAGQCYSFSQKEESKIILIGNEHIPESVQFEQRVVWEALNKNIVSLQESLVEDILSRRRIAKLMGYKDPGYLFGMENGLVDIFSDLVVEYSLLYLTITAPEECPDAWFERVKARKEVLLSQFQIGKAAQGFWKKFNRSKDRKNLNENIISIINNLIYSKEPLQKAKYKAYQKLSINENQWLDLFKYFGLYILENHVAKLTGDQQLDIEKIRNFLLEEPAKSENIFYIRFDVSTYWRNSFIKNNIKKAFTFAQQVKKPLFIIIGQDHFNDLESFIKSEGYPLESYALNNLFNEEFARAALKSEKTKKEF